MTDETRLDGAALLGGGKPVKVVRLPAGVQGAAPPSEPVPGPLPVQGALDGRELLAQSGPAAVGDRPISGEDLLRGGAGSSQDDDGADGSGEDDG